MKLIYQEHMECLYVTMLLQMLWRDKTSACSALWERSITSKLSSWNGLNRKQIRKGMIWRLLCSILVFQYIIYNLVIFWRQWPVQKLGSCRAQSWLCRQLQWMIVETTFVKLLLILMARLKEPQSCKWQVKYLLLTYILTFSSHLKVNKHHLSANFRASSISEDAISIWIHKRGRWHENNLFSEPSTTPL